MNTTTTTTEDLTTIKTLRDLLSQLTFGGEGLKVIGGAEDSVKAFNEATDALLTALNDIEDTVRRAAKC